MTEVMQGLLAEAKKNKYSTIKDNLSEDDVAAVWENVSSFIEKQMSQQKAVYVQTLGTFTFTQKKLDIGNNKFILIQRPVFNISEKLAQSQGLQYVKHHVPGQIPVVQLNYAAMSFESPYNRDVVESCVREILGAVQRAVGAKKNVELTFNGIGRLQIRDSRVKMKFYKDFISHMDGSGKLLDSLQNRPGTVDSVISDRCVSRPQSSNTVVLPKISNTGGNIGNGGLAPVTETEEVDNLDAQNLVNMEPETQPMGLGVPDDEVPNIIPDIYTQEGMEGMENEDVGTAAAIRHIEMGADPPVLGRVEPIDATQMYGMDLDKPDQVKKSPMITQSRSGSRMAAPVAMATGVSLLDDLVPFAQTPKSAPSLTKRSPPPPMEGFDKPKPPSQPLGPLQRSVSFDQMKPGDKVHTPPGTSCGHSNAGQELCYLCHQRTRRNIPVSFAEERRRREEEEDRLLQQYQYMKDAENVLNDTEMQMAKRQNLQKMAAFNLGVSEAVHQKKRERDTEFHRSYIFQRRPLTPPRFGKQLEYSSDLSKQVESKENVRAKRKSDEDFLERLEQVQLAEDLAIQREQYLKERAEEQDQYKKALDTQLKFKPLEVPAREPDQEIFGRNDMTNEKMAERRRRAFEMFREQQDLVAQRKREGILKRLAEQKEEEEVLERNKLEIKDDRANRFRRRMDARKRLEDDWLRASEVRQERLMEDRIRALSPGILLHEQCNNYNRCKQCKRMIQNCGESNLWYDSRYIPGSRLMV